jgi:hypothetical protein
MRTKVMGCVLGITLSIVFALSLSVQSVDAAEVHGTLSNFDLYNHSGVPVNDMEMTLTGTGLTCSDIIDYYEGWGTSNNQPAGGCQQVSSGVIKIKWSNSVSILNDEYRHFGVRLRDGAPDVRVQQVTWTFDGVVKDTVPVLWQAWRGEVDCSMTDIIRRATGSDFQNRTYTVSRSWAYDEIGVSLNHLVRGDVRIESLDWHGPDVVTMPVGIDSLLLTIPPVPTGQRARAALVRYSAVDASAPNDTISYFINEVLYRESGVPSLTGYGMIVLAVALLVTAIWVVRKRRAGITTI